MAPFVTEKPSYSIPPLVSSHHINVSRHGAEEAPLLVPGEPRFDDDARGRKWKPLNMCWRGGGVTTFCPHTVAITAVLLDSVIPRVIGRTHHDAGWPNVHTRYVFCLKEGEHKQTETDRQRDEHEVWIRKAERGLANQNFGDG